MTETDMSQLDKVKDYYRRHRPNPDPLADAHYEIKDLGPFENHTEGRKLPMWYASLIVGFALYISYYAYYTMIQEPEYMLLEVIGQLNAGLVVFGFLMATATVSVALDMHKGIAGAYKYILLLHTWFLRRKKPARAEWRVLDGWQLWNPITKKGLWRDIETQKKELDNDALLAKKQELEREIERLKKEQKDIIVDRTIEAKLKSLGPRFSSVKELISAARLISDAVKKEKIKDDIKEVMRIRERLMLIIEALDLGYYVTLLWLEGNIYPLVLSDLPLCGADDEGNAEFAIHELSVRSWLEWAARTVKNACLGSILHLDDYRFHILPHRKLLFFGDKEEKIKYSPIVYVVNSEGQVNRIKREHFHSSELKEDPKPKLAPSINDVIQAEMVYSSTVADDALEKLKLVTSQDNKKNKSREELRREYEAMAKNTVAEGLRLSRRTNKVGAGLLGGLRISLGQLPKYLFYSVVVVFAVLGMIAILQSIGLIDLGWFVPPDAPPQDDEWNLVISGLRHLWGMMA